MTSPVAAAAILVTVVLPSECGIDPTGVGWFWRNRDKQDVTVTLFFRGDYSEMKLP